MVLTLPTGNGRRRHSGGQSANEQPHDVSPKPANLTCSRQPLLPTLTARALPDGVADMQWIGWAVIGVMVWSGSGRAEQRQTLLLPVSTTCISSAFGPRILPNHPQAGTFHNGLDLPAPEGTPVRAVASGKLLRIERGGPGGLEVLVQHDRYVSVYSHLASIAPSLDKGVIAAGDEIGVVGHTGLSFGPHLFFALLENGRAIDPRPFLGMPLCNGTTAHQRTLAEIVAAGDKLPPTRRYYLLSDFPAAHHGQARSALTDRLCTTAGVM